MGTTLTADLPLERGPKKRLALISAPAGYGKTTMVVQCMDQVRRNSAWLSLHKNDSDNAIPSDFTFRHDIYDHIGCFVMNNLIKILFLPIYHFQENDSVRR